MPYRTKSKTFICKVRYPSQEPPDSPYQYALRRELERKGNVLAQIMAKHFLDNPRLIGGELAYGFHIVTARRLRDEARIARAEADS